MLRLRLPRALLERLQATLHAAGSNEVGGVLVGEHVAENTFHLVDLSVQATPGNHVCFVRVPAEHAAFIEGFHSRTGHNYTRFNYLGEWHSHPSFPVAPSRQDAATMQAIVDDEDEPAQFAVLLIARLDRRRLRLGAVAFRTGLPSMPVHLEVDGSVLSAARRSWTAVTAPFRRSHKLVDHEGDFHD